MPLSTLTLHPSYESNPKLAKAAHNLSTLLAAIAKKNIPESVEIKINVIIAGVNNFPGQPPQLLKQLKSAQSAILKLLESELGLVAKNHYQLQWLAIGMATFGIPLGVVFGASLGNMAFLGIGLPIGMAIGIAIGTNKDKQAEEEGKQLDWTAK
ncbi:hypothetical protein PBT90_15100 [Algoriphagus halophytocola]|uniref:Glycine zipper family protein n=1 Tax=Algoriphagus halophytocola TaxID=2991499 RepID=A0ABY6MNH4_9BACT|nr:MULTISPECIES: hypothetical protein [unclassified Algoriphagus]UZD24703.1 hypothetical protein OM944_09435 [Algoriphagus sp. TR-M5]WBL42071.1 hypothetical protein PBT90_15100 [Algoriphagus sp. TR-M9]